jgi:hypothetical protein
MEFQFMTFEERVETLGIEDVLRNTCEEIERLGESVDGEFNLPHFDELLSHLRSTGLYPLDDSSKEFISAWEKARFDFLESRNRLG